ncbi:type III secretion system inner rod subunit SctI [Yersinia mollaretii]|uniref:Virulence associated protein n=1 Tax=Yersinia mollaretii TaxID=33060 RepID=A0AA36LL53_YERMO|nr:type III secretion system inner rod subunit SctI [Yersinia mollaretii]MDA5537123.1 type III secretion system inner rod subunit SctI [Yersinia mollaretii]NIL05025.1 type III secretion system inner rod subunit SctI [Yersinia mollaretii]CNH90126.1 putative virulence associated protein [Yersinia mollaretii]
MFINLTPAIAPVAENNLPAMGITAPVEDRVRSQFARYSVAASQEKAALFDQVNNGDATNPVELLRLQNRVGNYSLAINMISTLTHKSASAIDSVLKAQ